MGIILWIIFGGLAGWIASMIMNTDAEQGVGLNVVVGIVGALIGGFVFQAFGQSGVSVTGFNLYSFGVAIVGSIILLGALKLVRSA